MGSGDRHLLNNLLHHRYVNGGSKKDHHHPPPPSPHVPKGCLAVMVGPEGEERQRFVVPVTYLSHPLFMQLLKEAEDEYGFEQKGTITLPCHIEEFRCVRGLIEREICPSSYHGGGGHGRHHHHLPHNLVACFRA